MQQINKEDLKNLLDKSSDELHRRIDTHYCKIAMMLEGTAGDSSAAVPLMKYSSFERKDRFKAAFEETITVLEETRRAFKSKKLEALRKKLTRVLIDTE